MNIVTFFFIMMCFALQAKDKSKAVTQKPTLSTQTVKIQSSAAPKEDIYIDDDTNIQAEGSGISDFKDDLESSGSGFGPDDEDGDGPLINKGKIQTFFQYLPNFFILFFGLAGKL